MTERKLPYLNLDNFKIDEEASHYIDCIGSSFSRLIGKIEMLHSEDKITATTMNSMIEDLDALTHVLEDLKIARINKLED